MSGTATSSKDDGSIMDDSTEAQRIVDLKCKDWPSSMPTLLADPVIRRHAKTCPVTGFLLISNIHLFMEAVHQRYGKAKSFDNFKSQMTNKWGWIFLGKTRGGNCCYCVHEMGFGRGGFDWAKHPTPDEVQKVR